MDWLAIEPGSAAEGRVVAFFTDRVEDRAGDGTAPLGERNAHGIMGHSMHVIGSAIKGIDDPAILTIGLRALGIFFADEAMIGEMPANDATDGLLRSEIGLGYQVARSLFANFKPPQPLAQYGTAGASRSLANLDKFGHGAPKAAKNRIIVRAQRLARPENQQESRPSIRSGRRAARPSPTGDKKNICGH